MERRPYVAPCSSLNLGSSTKGLGAGGFCVVSKLFLGLGSSGDCRCCFWNLLEPLSQSGRHTQSAPITIDITDSFTLRILSNFFSRPWYYLICCVPSSYCCYYLGLQHLSLLPCSLLYWQTHWFGLIVKFTVTVWIWKSHSILVILKHLWKCHHFLILGLLAYTWHSSVCIV